jgi:hypothetical protein
MRVDLITSPKVVRMASALGAHKYTVLGGLLATWALFDAHSEDGVLVGYTPQALDDHLNMPGFTAAMIAVEWLTDSGESLMVPRFDCHNGQSAKRRAQETERKRLARQMSAPDADDLRSRKENKTKHIPVEIEQPTSPDGDTPPVVSKKPNSRGKQADADNMRAIAVQQYIDVFPDKRAPNIAGLGNGTLKAVDKTGDALAQKVVGVADCSKLSRDDIEALWHLYWRRCTDSDRIMGRSQSPQYDNKFPFSFGKAQEPWFVDKVISGTLFDLDGRSLADIWGDLFGQEQIAA